jgi:copper chaperone
MVENMKIKLIGMDCRNCALKVEYRLRNLDGVNSVSINLAKGEAIVSYDPNTTGFNTFQAAIQKSGYRASRLSLYTVD